MAMAIMIISGIINVITICMLYNTRKWLTQNDYRLKSIVDNVVSLNNLTEYNIVTMYDLIEELQDSNSISDDFDIELYKNMVDSLVDDKETNNDNKDSD